MTRSPVGQWWQYPLAAPSYRFTQINDYIRRLDRDFDVKPIADKRKWEEAAQKWYILGRCVPWVFDYDPLDLDPVDGVACYRSVNCANLVNGLARVEDPPATVVLPDNDTIDGVYEGPIAAVWSGRLAAPPGDFFAWVRAVNLTHAPESGPAIQKYKWVGVVPITYDTPFDLTFIFGVLPGYLAMPCMSVAVTVCQIGRTPLAGYRLVFRKPYNGSSLAARSISSQIV